MEQTKKAAIHKLPMRLATIAEEIRRGETMADIGTDQGLLPVALYQDEICPFLIATDISQASLQRARQHARTVLAKRKEAISFRSGDGLAVLQPGEVDVVVIAGMGGKLIASMLERDEDHSRSFPRYILQPRKDPGLVRHWLVNHGYFLIGERLVPEGRHISEIILAARRDEEKQDVDQHEWSGMIKDLLSSMQGKSGEDICWQVPPWWRVDGHHVAAKGQAQREIVKQYLNQRLAWEEEILAQQAKAGTPKQAGTERRIAYLKKLGATHEDQGTDSSH